MKMLMKVFEPCGFSRCMMGHLWIIVLCGNNYKWTANKACTITRNVENVKKMTKMKKRLIMI